MTKFEKPVHIYKGMCAKNEDPDCPGCHYGREVELQGKTLAELKIEYEKRIDFMLLTRIDITNSLIRHALEVQLEWMQDYDAGLNPGPLPDYIQEVISKSSTEDDEDDDGVQLMTPGQEVCDHQWVYDRTTETRTCMRCFLEESYNIDEDSCHHSWYHDGDGTKQCRHCDKVELVDTEDPPQLGNCQHHWKFIGDLQGHQCDFCKAIRDPKGKVIWPVSYLQAQHSAT